MANAVCVASFQNNEITQGITDAECLENGPGRYDLIAELRLQILQTLSFLSNIHHLQVGKLAAAAAAAGALDAQRYIPHVCAEVCHPRAREIKAFVSLTLTGTV